MVAKLNCRPLWTRLVAFQKYQKLKRLRKSSSRNPALFFFFVDSPPVFAFQKCEKSRGSGGLWSRNPDLSCVLDSCRVIVSQRGWLSQNCRLFWTVSGLRVFKSQQSQRPGRCGRETQNCRQMLIRFRSLRFKKKDQVWISCFKMLRAIRIKRARKKEESKEERGEKEERGDRRQERRGKEKKQRNDKRKERK